MDWIFIVANSVHPVETKETFPVNATPCKRNKPKYYRGVQFSRIQEPGVGSQEKKKSLKAEPKKG
jgi:hypothetical protein